MPVPKGTRIGGRQKGTPNKEGANIKAVAALHGKEAIEHLIFLMKNADSHQVQVSAAREILDRAYGKPVQAVEGSMNVTVSHEELLDHIETVVSEAAQSDAAYH